MGDLKGACTCTTYLRAVVRKATWLAKVVAQNKIYKNEPINNNWLFLDTCSSTSIIKNAYLAKNVKNCNSEEKFLMLTNGRNPSFKNMGDLLLLPMKFHINESSMENILYFSEVANISGVHIKMEMS